MSSDHKWWITRASNFQWFVVPPIADAGHTKVRVYPTGAEALAAFAAGGDR